jgi:hypothetical protein
MKTTLTDRAAKARKPDIGDERYMVEMIDLERVKAVARKHGYTGRGGEGLREFCEPEQAAVYSIHATLDEATAAAKAYLLKGTSFYGSTIIDHEVFERWQDDLGNRVKGASWECQRSWEVAQDGERIEVGR